MAGLAIAGAGVYFLSSNPAPPAPRPAPASLPSATRATATTPATEPSPPSPPTTRIIDVLVASDPRFRGAKPLANPVTVDDGASVILDHPAYIDPRGDLWITDPKAPPVDEVMRTPGAGDEAVHVTRDEVAWARWVRDNRGNWVCQPVTREGAHLLWHAQDRAIPLERSDYRFDALSLMPDDRIVVPTDAGVTVIRPPAILQPLKRGATSRPATAPSRLSEAFAPIAGTTPVCCYATPDGKIVLAFRPWDNGEQGSEGILRLTDGAWAPLPDNAFPKQPIHVFFMTDGSLQFVSLGEDGGIDVNVETPLESRPVNEGVLEKLVEKLNDPDDITRDTAEDAIARFGPSAWPVLEKLRPAQSPEGQKVIDHLLGARQQRTLGIFTFRPGAAHIVGRSPDGSLAILTVGGVSFLDNENDRFASPALVIDRPGKPVFLAHESAIDKRDPEKFRLQMYKDDLFTVDPLGGLLRHMSNHYSVLLKPKFREFTRWVGQDREYRWLLQNPATGRYLLLDPNYADPTPRLPAWTIEQAGSGYDDADHPAVARVDAANQDRTYWQLAEAGWRPIDGQRNHFHVEPKRGSATARLSDGTTVTADMANLTFRPRASTRPTTQPLPPEAFGINPPTLLYAAEHLFLFNTPGRVTRFGLNKEGRWALDATFTADIPSGEVRRVWLDPFGRICVLWGDNLTILFPDGQIPADLADLIHANKK